jgi:hypothetical protein
MDTASEPLEGRQEGMGTGLEKHAPGVWICQSPHVKYAMLTATSHPFDANYPKNQLSGTASTGIIGTVAATIPCEREFTHPHGRNARQELPVEYLWLAAQVVDDQRQFIDDGHQTSVEWTFDRRWRG